MWQKRARSRKFSALIWRGNERETFSEVAGSLRKNNVEYSVFDDVLCEPSDASMIKGWRAYIFSAIQARFSAVDFAKQGGFDCFIAVGGGSVIDTTKVNKPSAYKRAANQNKHF